MASTLNQVLVTTKAFIATTKTKEFNVRAHLVSCTWAYRNDEDVRCKFCGSKFQQNNKDHNNFGLPIDHSICYAFDSPTVRVQMRKILQELKKAKTKNPIAMRLKMLRYD